jgi:hypothetical protein
LFKSFKAFSEQKGSNRVLNFEPIEQLEL